MNIMSGAQAAAQGMGEKSNGSTDADMPPASPVFLPHKKQRLAFHSKHSAVAFAAKCLPIFVYTG